MAADILAALANQPRVKTYLERVIQQDRPSHAYLFVGPPGSGQREAALAFAQALVCPEGGCGRCESCRKVAQQLHPDVTVLAPESAGAYLIGQIQELQERVALAPVVAPRKVIILESAESLKPGTANALLKTIEEPPERVVFILLAPSSDRVLQTIVSRCQVVPFSPLKPAEVAAKLAAELNQDPAQVRYVLALAQTPDRVRTWFAPEGARRREAADQMVRCLETLSSASAWDILKQARQIIDLVKVRSAKDQQDLTFADPIQILIDADKNTKKLKPAEARQLKRALQAALEGEPLERAAKDQLAPYVDQAEAQGLMSAVDALRTREVLERGVDKAVNKEYLSAKAQRESDQRIKRQDNAAGFWAIMEVLAAADVFLGGLLAMAQGVPAAVLAPGQAARLSALAVRLDVGSILDALEAVARARTALARNATPRLALEVMLLDIKEALWR